ERAETWSEFLQDVPRATMEREGSVVPWIMASDLLVHTNCTTGVEAFALGKPAISLQPAELAIADTYLANLVNYRTKTVDETLDRIEWLVNRSPSDPAYPPEFAATFDHFFAATRGPFACERIVETLQQELGLGLSLAAERPSWRARPGYRRKTRIRRHHTLV